MEWLLRRSCLLILMAIAAMMTQVYRKTVQPLVHTLFQNGKATCFAYGQTGSGKTFTMSPLPIRAAADILQYLARPEYNDISLFVSCFEIYGNKVFDLLNSRKKLNIMEDSKKKVVVVGLKVSRGGRPGHQRPHHPCVPSMLARNQPRIALEARVPTAGIHTSELSEPCQNLRLCAICSCGIVLF